MSVHFIAIGGSVMHNLAIALHKEGYTVTGSDDAFYDPSKSRLSSYGLLPSKVGWFTNKITLDIGFVILGMHAREDNPELQKAQKLDLKIYSYPEYLYQHHQNKTRVVIAGSHGKTTITSMVLHVLQYHDIDIDYMVGAQLKGFDTMVHLTDSNDFVVLEGDEYLTSTMDKKPKMHWYRPNIAVISGIAWDHINVFPTLDAYINSFRVFIEKVVNGGVLIYNEEDHELTKIIDQDSNPIRKIPYKTPSHTIVNGQTFLETPMGDLPLQFFGQHNLNNMAAAKLVCQQMRIDETSFYEAILTFSGASKRLEKISETPKSVIYKDFAHSPSKVLATTKAFKKQYPNRKLIACLELHTYSSLDLSFLNEYAHTLDDATIAIAFYDLNALKIKRKQPLSEQQIRSGFGRQDLVLYTDTKALEAFITTQKQEGTNFLMMSSGTFGGMEIPFVDSF